MGERGWRNCDRTADAGACCRNCADLIMAKVILFYHWKMLLKF